MNDQIFQPTHYTRFKDKFGVEPIDFTRYMTFPAGCVFKYLARHEEKGNPLQDLKKAQVYNDWAQHDFQTYGLHAILPGKEGLLYTMCTRYLNGHLFGAYRGLKHILYNSHDEAWWAIHDAMEEL